MTTEIRLSEAELDLMAELWRESPLAAADIGKRISRRRDWSPTTIKTMLARLVEKGAVSTEAEGRRYLYRPAVDRDDVIAAQAGRLVDRLLGGKISPLVAQLTSGRDLSDEDVDELEKLVRELRK